MPKIGVRLPAGFDAAGEFLADVRALEAAGVDLLVLGDGPLDSVLLLAALAAVTSTAVLGAPPAEPGQLETLRLLSRGRLAENLEGWLEEAFPESKSAWRESLAEHDAKLTPGVILAMDPRLLDLLRNPELEDDRSQDLQLAQG
jgi:alkanesulfonate monooxygenase SsuD/methylene tetrahydromethanopterin reductase-like flavin-dependent oxidoreductase (luciferase family)